MPSFALIQVGYYYLNGHGDILHISKCVNKFLGFYEAFQRTGPQTGYRWSYGKDGRFSRDLERAETPYYRDLVEGPFTTFEEAERAAAIFGVEFQWERPAVETRSLILD